MLWHNTHLDWKIKTFYPLTPISKLNHCHYYLSVNNLPLILVICTQVPQGQIDLLPVNFFVNNLLSMVALHKDSGSGGLECDVCDSGDPPVNRCTTCSHFLCEVCTQGHQRARITRSHSLISLEEVKKMGSVAVKRMLVCNEHEGEVIKLFCETYEEALCRDCTIVKHRDHEYTFVN